MTEEEIAEIRARYALTVASGTPPERFRAAMTTLLAADIPALLAAYDALQADRTALRHALVELASTVHALALAQRLQPDGDGTALQGRLTAALWAAEAALGPILPTNAR